MSTLDLTSKGSPARDRFRPIVWSLKYKLTGLPLEKGWNHFLVRVANDRGGWRFQARLQCRYPTLASLLRTDVARPAP